MSHFSKEFISYQGLKIEFQFSYLELFENLGVNESVYQISLRGCLRRCDGFETIGIKNLNGIPFLVKNNGQEINLQKLLAEKEN